jgi:hypothetical protein
MRLRGHGNAVSLPRLIVGKRHCRVLTITVSLPQNNLVGTRHCLGLISANINSDATGFDINSSCTVRIESKAMPCPYPKIIL